MDGKVVKFNDKFAFKLERKKRKSIPIISVVGRSNSGKTSLLEKLIAELKARGLRIGTIKHDVHGFEMDHPGKDSWRHKQAGASTTIISSAQRVGMVRDVDHDHDPKELINLMGNIDIVLTEGYKYQSRPKLEIYRPELHKVPLCLHDENLLAFVCDQPIDIGVPRFLKDDIQGLGDFIMQYLALWNDPALSELQENEMIFGDKDWRCRGKT